MNLTVAGLWHLGCVTAACCARHFQVTGFDFDPDTIEQLNQGKAPLFEPGLDDLIAAGLGEQKLRFTTDVRAACAQADLLWITYDTPVNDNDESDVPSVLERIGRCLEHLRPGTLVLVSSQLPVGTCRKLEGLYPQFQFACSPENLRLGRALQAFQKADRVVVGVRHDGQKTPLEKLFTPFTPRVLWMRTESAEMVKHGLNCFLALSITFINELARICEQTGADAREVSAGLKSDPRIGPNAYLGPGAAIAGGTLARDVITLTRLAAETGQTLAVIPAIMPSNQQHLAWPFQRLLARLGDLRGQSIAILGLAYTPNTDTLRRSSAVELCRKLLAAGAIVRAYDPAVKTLPPELSAVTLADSMADAINNADAAVVCTEWPQFREAPWPALLKSMRKTVIVEASRFLEKELKDEPGVEHLSVGRPA